MRFWTLEIPVGGSSYFRAITEFLEMQFERVIAEPRRSRGIGWKAKGPLSIVWLHVETRFQSALVFMPIFKRLLRPVDQGD